MSLYRYVVISKIKKAGELLLFSFFPPFGRGRAYRFANSTTLSTAADKPSRFLPPALA